ncbi:glycosyltransferase family 2 protein [Methanobrevibacter sp. UBA337]|jgi:glycosyltransferase involved in cell wall biosynthesis|uniref:glycosyltransferase family 2 protein n=1 Tax=Methanobrevibacter sp. UBA337 TaxID=1915480 RepID=UPI0039B84373
MTYLISVIIPIYNGENVIKNSINSLINQTIKFENIEVLLIDDNSTDNSLDIIKSFSKKYENIKVIHLNKNYGTPGNPRNVGMKKASTNYIMFLDQDDYYLNDMCKTLYDKIEKEKVDFVSCLYCFNTEKNMESAKLYANFLEKYGSELKINNIHKLPELFEVTNPHSSMVWNKIYNKLFLLKNNIKFPKKCLAEDMDFNVQCFLNGNFILLNNYIGYYYITHDSSVSHTPTEKNLYKLLCGFKMIFEYLNNKKYKIPKIISEEIVFWTMLFLNNKLSIEKQKELLKTSKSFYTNFNLNNKRIHNSSFGTSIQNIFIKIFSSNIYISIIITKFYQLFKINKIYNKILSSNEINTKLEDK